MGAFNLSTATAEPDMPQYIITNIKRDILFFLVIAILSPSFTSAVYTPTFYTTLTTKLKRTALVAYSMNSEYLNFTKSALSSQQKNAFS